MPRSAIGQSRTTAGTRTAPGYGRMRIQPYYMHFVSATQRLSATAVSANKLDGLSGGTMVMRFRINSVVSGGVFFASPLDATANASFMVFKNTNSTNQQFRIGTCMNAVSQTFDLNNAPTNQRTYDLNTWMTVALRFTGTLIEFWKDGVKLGSVTANNTTFGTANTSFWAVSSDGAGNNRANIDVQFARMWTSSLSNTNLGYAMGQNYRTGAALDLSFLEGSGTPVDSANGATVTLSGSPTWVANESRSLAT